MIAINQVRKKDSNSLDLEITEDADDSIDGEVIKEQLMGCPDNVRKSNFVCEICGKTFKFSSVYDRHKRNYPGQHTYHKCCNKVGVETSHKCRSLKNTKVRKKKTSEEDDDEREYLNNNADVDDVFGKQKRPYKRKSLTEKFDEKNKVHKCQECSKSFDKSFSLSQHVKIAHKKQGKFKCQICEEEFGANEDYEEHVAMHGPEDQVVCKGCRKTFESLKLYYIHARQNPGVHCFLCKLCLRKFPTELMLEQHVCICQNGKPLHCACGKEFTKYSDVIVHSKGTKPFNCCSCPHQSTSLTAYIRHLRRHSKQKPYQCAKCDMKFAVIDFLNIHNKKHHGDGASERSKEQIPVERYTCTHCDEEFETADDFKKHSQQHERVQCPDCGKMLKVNRLENHRNTHKTSASLCPECGKLFDTRFKLTQHIITTHNNEPVKCDVCLKVLKTKKILNEHMKTHLKSEVGERIPQAICPMCGLGLAQKGSLARHILLTHEKHKIVPCDKTYTCKECSAVLPNRGKYYSHRRMHRAMIDRFPCEICGREFNKKQNLRRHIYLLHDERRVLAEPTYKCQICTRCFREKKNLKRHYKMVHKLDDIV